MRRVPATVILLGILRLVDSLKLPPTSFAQVQQDLVVDESGWDDEFVAAEHDPKVKQILEKYNAYEPWDRP